MILKRQQNIIELVTRPDPIVEGHCVASLDRDLEEQPVPSAAPKGGVSGSHVTGLKGVRLLGRHAYGRLV